MRQNMTLSQKSYTRQRILYINKNFNLPRKYNTHLTTYTHLTTQHQTHETKIDRIQRKNRQSSNKNWRCQYSTYNKGLNNQK